VNKTAGIHNEFRQIFRFFAGHFVII
jgi:hypothetical protein